MSGIFVVPIEGSLADTLSEMDLLTNEWTAQAARGETAWICSDCCCTFSDGMPDACVHGHQGCTDLIQRDKASAPKDQP